MSRFVGVLALAACLNSVALSQVIIKSQTKDGTEVSSTFSVSVVVESQSLVSQVEFYVDDNLVSTDDSTPYEFQMDSLSRDDGPLVLTIAAYSRSGESAKLQLLLNVNNGLSLGANHHIEIAEGHSRGQRWAKSIEAARVALKIEPNNNKARLAIARAYYGAGNFDRAQKFAEDILASDASNVAAHDLLSAVGLKKAFYAIQYGGGDKRTLEAISGALRASAKNTNDGFARRLAQFGQVNDDNRLRYVDLLIQSGRYSLAIDELTPLFRKDERSSEIANRLVYAMLSAGRYREAESTMRRHSKVADRDAYGYALTAVIADWFGDDKGSLGAEQEALLDNPNNLGVKTAQAFLALRRGKIQTVESIVTRLAATNTFSATTNYYLTALYFIQNKFEESNAAFQQTLLSDPSLYPVHIERFNQAIAYYYSVKDTVEDPQFQLDFARAFAEGALEAKPESFEALTALALLSLIEKKNDDALRFAQAAVAAGPQYAAAHYALSAAYFESHMLDRGMKALADAGKYDARSLSGIRAPSIEVAWRYFSVRGRTPILSPPGA